MADVLVLCYHAASPQWDSELSVGPEALRHQLSLLLGRGWRPARFSDAVLAPTARRTLAVTFDDAFLSVYRHAAPVLDELGVVATVYVPTGPVSTGQPLSWPGTDGWLDGPHAGELEPMSWSALRELAARGWEIGSHTCTHPRLTQCSDEQLARELAESRRVCGDELGAEVISIAYPYGDVDDRVEAAAAAAGYRTGTGLGSRLEARGVLRWPRVGVYPADVAWRFRLKVARPMRRLRASALWPR